MGGHIQDGVDNGNYAYDNGWDMFEKDMRSGDFRPESAVEDFDPEDYLDDEDCFDEWESHQPSIGEEGWEDYYEERYGPSPAWISAQSIIPWSSRRRCWTNNLWCCSVSKICVLVCFVRLGPAVINIIS